MNGHSTAETLAFELLEVKRRLNGNTSGSEERPIFLFAAGWHAGDSELRRRLAPTVQLAPADTVDPSLLDRLTWQFMYFARKALARPSPPESSAHDGDKGAQQALTVLALAQAAFLRALALQGNTACDQWGLALVGVTADYAHYLKLLFPNASVLFLHRDPIETFQRSPEWACGDAPPWPRAASFAEGWCKIISGFQLWHQDVDALAVRYDQVIAARPVEIEAHLGQELAPLAAQSHDTPAVPTLHSDQWRIVTDRTSELASRLGYSMELATSQSLATKSAPLPAAVALADQARGGVGLKRCAVLVPTTRYIEPDCEAALRELERRGYAVRRLHGCSAIDAARNRLATWALDEGFDETLWVDADTGFDPEVVERLRSHQLPIVAGICAKKNPSGGLAAATLPGSVELVMGDEGGLVEVLYAGTGFMLVRREVYTAIQSRFDLPICSPSAPQRAIPFFMPMLEHWGGEMSYLAEDYAFSRRARLCGFKIMADTSIRLWHIGMYRYGYEDAGNAVERVATYRHVFERGNRE